MLSAFTIKALASLKSFTLAPDQYPVVQVAVSQLPPSVIHSSVRNTSQTHIAFLGSEGSTVQRLLRHHVHGVPLGHRRTFLPCLNCSKGKRGITVRIPLASVLGWVVLHGTEVLPSFPRYLTLWGLEKAKKSAGKFFSRFRPRLTRRSFKNMSPVRQAESPQVCICALRSHDFLFPTLIFPS